MTFVVKEKQKTQAELLAEWLGLRRTSRRQEIWLWLYLDRRRSTDLPLESCGGISMQREILSALSKNSYLCNRNRIQNAMDRQLVSDEQLSWITEDERQLRWLQRELPHDLPLLPRRIAHLTDREHLIAMLDIWACRPTEKVALVERLRQSWVQHTARDSDFEWFQDRKTEAERCKCAWEWLEKKYLHPSHRRERIDSYQALLMFFDRENLVREKQQGIIQKIKQRWNRQQLDVRNPESKQVNIMLTTETISQLDQLAKLYGLSRAKVVAKLIGKESELGLYLAE